MLHTGANFDPFLSCDAQKPSSVIGTTFLSKKTYLPKKLCSNFHDPANSEPSKCALMYSEYTRCLHPSSEIRISVKYPKEFPSNFSPQFLRQIGLF